MKPLVIGMAFGLIVLSGFIYIYFGLLEFLGFLSGLTAAAMSAFMIWFFLRSLLHKKVFAFAFALVVLKVPILAGFIWYIMSFFRSYPTVDPVVWMALGVLVFTTLFAIGAVRAFYLV